MTRQTHDPQDSRYNQKGWSPLQRLFQWGCTGLVIMFVGWAALALMDAELWMRGLFHE